MSWLRDAITFRRKTVEKRVLLLQVLVLMEEVAVQVPMFSVFEEDDHFIAIDRAREVWFPNVIGKLAKLIKLVLFVIIYN